tara:strand:- start:1218 stop:1673 length:456 start_codon:yes stop_codon:yes gene_type:complete
MIQRIIICSIACLLLIGCQSNDAGYEFAIKPAWNHQMNGLQHYSLANGNNIWVQQGAIVTADDIKKATYTPDNLGEPAVTITLDAAGSARMSRFTSGHLNQPLAVFVDDNLLSAPMVRSELSNQFMILGMSDKDHAMAFIDRCNKLIDSKN